MRRRPKVAAVFVLGAQSKIVQRSLACGQQKSLASVRKGGEDSWSSGIGDFAEDGGASSAGGGREIGGAAVKRFVGHEGEG